ncbi:hypothetical protein LOK49_LG14G01509 [Camellia lanceoleosa]|uniref:Uncharacterized protein n=1 Tax=Camellia lanceoleosa TaxID=1840588 RepID=A0ACC0FFG1_9ERIC|nr:hypothetical protein LOK49_LG14G01509 [Camellia lanceoleosa]
MGEGSSYCNGVKTSCEENGGYCSNSEDGKEEDDEVEVDLAGVVDNEAVLPLYGKGCNSNMVEGKEMDFNATTVSRVTESVCGLGIGGMGGARLETKRHLFDIQIQSDNVGSRQAAGHDVNVGFMRSLSGFELELPNINLEVVIRLVHDKRALNNLCADQNSDPKFIGMGQEVNNMISKANRAGQVFIQSGHSRMVGSELEVNSSRRNEVQNKGKRKVVVAHHTAQYASEVVVSYDVAVGLLCRCMLLLSWALIWGAVWLSCCWLSMRFGVAANVAGLICYSVLLSAATVMISRSCPVAGTIWVLHGDCYCEVGYWMSQGCRALAVFFWSGVLLIGDSAGELCGLNCVGMYCME